MERSELREVWEEMAGEGNWVPSWTDSLQGLTAGRAAWVPGPDGHSVWQEVVHVTFWRRATLTRMQGGTPPNEEEVEAQEFAAPAMKSPEATEEAWAAALADLDETYEAIKAALDDENSNIDLERVKYHIIHDAYHLGRITLIRAMQGTPPPF